MIYIKFFPFFDSIRSGTYLINNIFSPENRTVMEIKHIVCDLESTETIKCSAKVESGLTKNVSWYNGSTNVKIKPGGRIKFNGLSLRINNVQLDDAGTYECRAVSSSRFYTIYVNSEYSLYSCFSNCQFSVNFVTPNPNPNLTNYI